MKELEENSDWDEITDITIFLKCLDSNGFLDSRKQKNLKPTNANDRNEDECLIDLEIQSMQKQSNLQVFETLVTWKDAKTLKTEYFQFLIAW